MTTYTWNAPFGGSFNTGTNWTPNGIPGTLDLAVFSLGGDYSVSGDGTPGAILVTDDVTFTGSIDAAGSVTGTAYALEVGGAGAATFVGSTLEAGAVIVAATGAGLLNLETEFGTISAETALQIADAVGTVGTVLVQDKASFSVTGAVDVGLLGSGTLVVQNNGTLDVFNAGSGPAVFAIGVSAGAEGLVGVQYGGTGSIGEAVMLGVSAEATGSLDITEFGTLDLTAGLTIGQYGTGAVGISDSGTLSITGSAPIVLGEYADAVGSLTLTAGGTLSAQSAILVGDAGSGTLYVGLGGGLTTNSGGAASVFGVLAGASGSGTVDTDGLWNNHEGLVVGRQGSGTITVQDGGTLALGGQTLAIAEYAGSTGLLTVDSGTVKSDNAPLSIGPVASATTDATGGGSGTLELQFDSTVQVGTVSLARLVGGFGSLDVMDGATLAASGALVTGAGSSVITAEYGSVINARGATIGGGGGASATLTYDADFNDTGGLTLDARGTLSLDASSTLTAGGIALAGGTLAVVAEPYTASTVTVSPLIDVTGGSAAAPAALLGDATTDLVLSGGVAFRSGAAVLLINSGFDPGNKISGLHAGDTIDLQNEVYNTASYDVGTQQLVLTEALHTLVLNVADNGYTAHSFSAVSDHHGGTDVSLACYLAGTRIATASGACPVEHLRVGDAVALADGGTAPIIWIGGRRVDPARHPHPWELHPVRIGRGALGAGLPRRDLLVSPDHAVLLDGVLIEARRLCNGGSIRQVDLGPVHYLHVELERHDLLLAEGVAAESYRDTGNRGSLGGAVPTLHPQFATGRSTCAPVATEAQAQAIWHRLAGPTDAAPGTADAAPRLLVGERHLRPLHAAGAKLWFALPPGCLRARLLSRAAAPTWQAPWRDDRRRLGLAVTRLRLHHGAAVTDLALDGPQLGTGWWDIERAGPAAQRWTDGDAGLVLPHSADWLEVTAQPLPAYPVATTPAKIVTAR